jgi:hypothetical protein
MEHRVHITYDGILDEDRGDQLLTALHEIAAHLGPVLSMSTIEKTFTLTLAVDTDAIEVPAAAEILGLAELSALQVALGVGLVVGAQALEQIRMRADVHSVEVEPLHDHQPVAA